MFTRVFLQNVRLEIERLMLMIQKEGLFAFQTVSLIKLDKFDLGRQDNRTESLTSVLYLPLRQEYNMEKRYPVQN